jgi:hypothetical protein
MEDEKLFGKLFNTIPLYDESHLDTILTTMDKKTASYMLIQAVKFAYHQGVFSLGESEVISKSIRTYTKEETN